MNHSIIIRKIWESDSIDIWFDFPIECIEQNEGISVFKGPILFALPIASTKKILRERGRFSDYELWPESDWNYGLAKDSTWTLEYKNNVPILSGKACRIENWVEEKNSAGHIPNKPKEGNIENITLIPYGLTTLRVAAFPIIKGNPKS